MECGLLLYLEDILAETTEWACPIFWNILPCCASCYAILRISYLGVINIVTCCANVLFHNLNILRFKVFTS
jgi:hypothetical protein